MKRGPTNIFDIRLTSEALEEHDECAPAVYGTIRLGDFVETFLAFLSDWSVEDYQRQWEEAAIRLVDGKTTSAFVTSFESPSRSNHFEWWPCYLLGDMVHFQNQLKFYEQVPDFDIDKLYEFIGKRRTLSEDGVSPISEWQVPLSCVRRFLEKISAS